MTDDESTVRAKLLRNAIKALDVQFALMEPIPDPRALGDDLDGTALNRLLQTSSKAIDAWARTAEPPKDAPIFTPEQRLAAALAVLENPPPELLSAMARRGMAIERRQVVELPERTEKR